MMFVFTGYATDESGVKFCPVLGSDYYDKSNDEIVQVHTTIWKSIKQSMRLKSDLVSSGIFTVMLCLKLTHVHV
jgi:hypothetical protein